MFFLECDLEEVDIEAFAISKYEVSNIEFKEFLDQGGYENPEFWDFPIVIKGKEYL